MVEEKYIGLILALAGTFLIGYVVTLTVARQWTLGRWRGSGGAVSFKLTCADRRLSLRKRSVHRPVPLAGVTSGCVVVLMYAVY
jgi:hypothetical protein